MRHETIHTVVALAAAVCALAPAGPAGTAELPDLLSHVSNRYQSTERYLLEGRLITRTAMGSQTVTHEAGLRIARQGDGKLLLAVSGGAMAMTFVSDGNSTWTYMKMLNQYTRREEAPLGNALGGVAGGAADFVEAAFGRFAHIDERSADAKTAGEETVVVNGKPVTCTLVELAAEEDQGFTRGPDKLWVDPRSGLVLRIVQRLQPEVGASIRLTFVFDVVQVNVDLPDSLFTFAPPPDAKLVSHLGPELPKPKWVGQPAPTFTLPGLDGRPYDLAAHKGSVVLLNFWATWCKPCLDEFPVIDKLYNRYRDQGLVVLAIATEPTDRLTSFLRRTPLPFPVLNDAQFAVTLTYGVTSIPVVVIIDRQGVVVDQFIGVQDEATLAEALVRAGVE